MTDETRVADRARDEVIALALSLADQYAAQADEFCPGETDWLILQTKASALRRFAKLVEEKKGQASS